MAPNTLFVLCMLLASLLLSTTVSAKHSTNNLLSEVDRLLADARALEEPDWRTFLTKVAFDVHDSNAKQIPLIPEAEDTPPVPKVTIGGEFVISTEIFGLDQALEFRTYEQGVYIPKPSAGEVPFVSFVSPDNEHAYSVSISQIYDEEELPEGMIRDRHAASEPMLEFRVRIEELDLSAIFHVKNIPEKFRQLPREQSGSRAEWIVANQRCVAALGRGAYPEPPASEYTREVLLKFMHLRIKVA